MAARTLNGEFKTKWAAAKIVLSSSSALNDAGKFRALNRVSSKIGYNMKRLEKEGPQAYLSYLPSNDYQSGDYGSNTGNDNIFAGMCGINGAEHDDAHASSGDGGGVSSRGGGGLTDRDSSVSLTSHSTIAPLGGEGKGGGTAAAAVLDVFATAEARMAAACKYAFEQYNSKQMSARKAQDAARLRFGVGPGKSTIVRSQTVYLSSLAPTGAGAAPAASRAPTTTSSSSSSSSTSASSSLSNTAGKKTGAFYTERNPHTDYSAIPAMANLRRSHEPTTFSSDSSPLSGSAIVTERTQQPQLSHNAVHDNGNGYHSSNSAWTGASAASTSPPAPAPTRDPWTQLAAAAAHSDIYEHQGITASQQPSSSSGGGGGENSSIGSYSKLLDPSSAFAMMVSAASSAAPVRETTAVPASLPFQGSSRSDSGSGSGSGSAAGSGAGSGSGSGSGSEPEPGFGSDSAGSEELLSAALSEVHAGSGPKAGGSSYINTASESPLVLDSDIQEHAQAKPQLQLQPQMQLPKYPHKCFRSVRDWLIGLRGDLSPGSKAAPSSGSARGATPTISKNEVKARLFLQLSKAQQAALVAANGVAQVRLRSAIDAGGGGSAGTMGSAAAAAAAAAAGDVDADRVVALAPTVGARAATAIRGIKTRKSGSARTVGLPTTCEASVREEESKIVTVVSDYYFYEFLKLHGSEIAKDLVINDSPLSNFSSDSGEWNDGSASTKVAPSKGKRKLSGLD
jgi:hypothetical protein